MHKNLIYVGWDEEKGLSKYEYEDKDGVRHPAIFDEEHYIEMPDIGIIDHQSAGMLKNYLKEKDISLKEFLTNKKYVVVIDGDEYWAFETYMRSGLINRDFITEIYDTAPEDMEYKEWLKEQDKNEENNQV